MAENNNHCQDAEACPLTILADFIDLQKKRQQNAESGFRAFFFDMAFALSAESFTLQFHLLFKRAAGFPTSQCLPSRRPPCPLCFKEPYQLSDLAGSMVATL